MLPDNYYFDAALRCWRREDQADIAYSDGDEVENRLAKIVKSATDVSLDSQELRDSISDWPSLYHLGRGRANLLLPIRDLLRGDVLEIGCGCGALTRAFGEAGANVTAVEGSTLRASIAADRCRDLGNVAVVVESFDCFVSSQRFDVITLIGVLEYARKYFHTDAPDPVKAMIDKARGMLRPGGILVIAIENQLGLKYLAGSPEDHVGTPMFGIEDLYGDSDVVTFGREELASIIRAADLSEQQWWYPFPDYKFPVSMFSEDGVATRECDLSPLLQNAVVVDPQRSVSTSFSLENAWPLVFRNGLAGELANSFLIVASDALIRNGERGVLAYHYATNRRKEFAKQVSFVRDEHSGVTVRHQPLTPDLPSRSDCPLHIVFEETPFVRGGHWQKRLIHILNTPGWSLTDLAEWAGVWLDAFVREAGLDDSGNGLDKGQLLPGKAFDAVPRNLILSDEKRAVFIDQEWILDRQISLGFLIFRAIGLSFFGITTVAEPRTGTELALSDILVEVSHAIGIPILEEDLESYVRQENEIQHFVTGSASTTLSTGLLMSWKLNVRQPAVWDPERYSTLEHEIQKKDTDLHSLADDVHNFIRVLSHKDNELSALGGEVQRLEQAIAEKQQTLAMLADEVHRLNSVVETKDADLHSLANEMRGCHSVLDAKDNALSALGAEVQRLEQAITEKQLALSALSDEVRRLNSIVTMKESALSTQATEIQRLEQVVADKEQAVAQLTNEVRRLYDVTLQKDAVVRELTAELNRLNAVVEETQAAIQVFRDAAFHLEGRIADALALAAGQADEIRRLNAEAAAATQSLSKAELMLGQTQDSLSLANQDISRMKQEIAAKDSCIGIQTTEISALSTALNQSELALAQVRAELTTSNTELRALRQTRWFRLREVLLFHPMSLRKLAHVACIVGAGVLPRTFRKKHAPRLARLLGIGGAVTTAAVAADGPYRVQLPPAPPEGGPRVAHIIANFMTGGSSRLVVDLIESLGGRYEQRVLTSYIPDPPAYVGLEIEECRFPEGVEPFLEYFGRTRPDLVHVHYWGDCDEPWYAKAIEAARQLGLPVIENINTPIEPFRSEAVVRYVYVSDYVRSVFGEKDPRHVTVYPGSNFSLFTRSGAQHAPDDCIGMVYRLERDKLNEEAIQPFIRVAQLRPRTRVLIVGGGSLLEPFRAAVEAAGVTANFEFTGYVGYELLPELYSRMSLFIAPVWKESFGQVSPFAMNMKVPVIGYDVGAIPEIIDDPDLVAPAADADRLAQIAIDLLDAPRRRRQIGERQRRRAQANFSVEAMIRHYADLYAEVATIRRKEAA